MMSTIRHWLLSLLLLTLLLPGVTGVARAQAVGPGPVQWRILSEAPISQEAGSSSRGHVLIGAGIGAAVGTAFGLAVVAIADCGGSGCTGERAVGVVGNAAAGALIGGLVGHVVYLIRR